MSGQNLRLSMLHLGLLVLAAGLAMGEGVVLTAFVLVFVVACSMRYTHQTSAYNWFEGYAKLCVLGLLGFVIAGLCALYLGGYGWRRPQELGRWGPFLLLPVGLFVACFCSRRMLEQAARAFLLALVCAAMFGIGCYLWDVRPGEGLLRTEFLTASQGLVPGSTRSVAGGFYFHRLKMAHVLLIGIGAFLSRLLCLKMTFGRRCLELLAVLLCVGCLFLTFTRAAFLGVAAATSVMLLATAPRLAWRLLAVGGVTLASLMLWPQISARILSIGHAEASSIRGLIWSQAVRILVDHPWGVGLGNYPQIVGGYYDLVDPNFPTRTYAHNMLLSAWAETGPLGLVAYGLMWWVWGHACWSHARHSQNETMRAVGCAGLFTCIALWTVGLTHDVLFHNIVSWAYVATLTWTLAYFQKYAHEIKQA